MKKRICLITPGHLSSNPRLVKEAIALSGAGMLVHLIFTQYVNDLVSYDQTLLAAHPEWSYDVLGWTQASFSSRITRLWSGLSQRFTKRPEVRLNRNFSWQLHKAVASRADLYVAHNLGALPVAVIAAEMTQSKCGFDAEDFHRFETSDDPADPDVQLKTAVEEKYIPRLDYLTTSSPQISEAYRGLFQNQRPVTLLNVFPKEPGVSPPFRENTGTVRLFWFSQTVGLNRGLQDIIAALQRLGTGYMELHILGNYTPEVKTQLIRDSGVPIKFYAYLPPGELVGFSAQFDIGLALEPGFCRNNNLALSNKIFTYLQAGLCIIASDTLAQKSFAAQHPDVGRVYPRGDVGALCDILHDLHRDRAALLAQKKAAWALAAGSLNWETEQQPYLELIRLTITLT